MNNLKTSNLTLNNPNHLISLLTDLNIEKETIKKPKEIPQDITLFVENVEKDYFTNKACIVKFKDLDDKYYLALKSYCEIIKKHANVVIYKGLINFDEYEKHTFYRIHSTE